ncbi:MAG TPA: hypothetical protein VJ795_18570 [Rheinheimera sp.]|uniref:hypothetical protein n=1 Tax=Rheinheimera sp. TaxID=1869214 RepID=UPI002B47A498|nr:hypothetical protein [Rheinheimera sp.]HJS17084.1 hypothetical protein [Rheinheimera sp.]
MKVVLLYPLLLATLAGCAVQQAPLPAKPGLTAWDAIVMSEQSAPEAVPGVFSLQIKNAAKIGDVVYLNTEYDYRDRRNVTLVLTPKLLKEFAASYPDQQADQYFLGRTIVVNGAASRQTIWFFSQGKPTEKYYFQTHIPIWYAGQILSPLAAKAYWQQNKKASEQSFTAEPIEPTAPQKANTGQE